MKEYRDYKPLEIEKKWQEHWEKKGTFKVKEDKSKPKYYVLEMLPYPSGRLHMGHVRNYAIGDVIARHKLMNGFNVLHPIGWDAFGMPAENAAIKRKSHPAKWTFDNIDYMRGQFKKLGVSYDWDREVATCTPEYYRWEQLVFLKMFEKGLVTRKNAMLNWCNTCQTVLANEQAEGGKCWRCDNAVELKPLTQWFVRIPLYAEELLKDIKELEQGWPERVLTMQRGWIGKSDGAAIRFQISDFKSQIEVFTTRPDTLFGATFMSIAAEHPLAVELSRGTAQEKDVQDFIAKTKKIGRMDRLLGNYEKDGVFTGAYCTNPVTGWKMPVYAANFVLMDYGTGAVMAVPAHDQRDYEFAKKYKLELVQVIQPNAGADVTPDAAYEGDGTLINSGEFNGMDNIKAKDAIVNYLKKQGFGDKTVNFKLKDWCISRQRYWGTPIPIIYCEKCGTVPVPEKDLPIELPKDVQLTGEGGSPLAKVEKFVNCKCPKCKGPARRETDTMDTFVESSWYFLRYCSPKYDKGPVDPAAAKYWMPVDQYIGGIEHAVGHLLYSRFFMKVLRDLGMLDFSPSNEPVKNLLTQGMVTLGGAAMSKSRGNIVDPDIIIEKYGADTARLFILFASPPEKDLEWSDQGIEGAWRFLNRVWRIVEGFEKDTASDAELDKWVHKTIKRVTEDIERFHFNTAISGIMELVNYLYSRPAGQLSRFAIETLVVLISPFAPHMAEELWKLLGHKDELARHAWPTFDATKVIEQNITVIVQVNGKLRDKLEVSKDISEDEIKKMATASDKVAPFLSGKDIKKIIYVPGKLVSIVI